MHILLAFALRALLEDEVQFSYLGLGQACTSTVPFSEYDDRRSNQDRMTRCTELITLYRSTRHLITSMRFQSFQWSEKHQMRGACLKGGFLGRNSHPVMLGGGEMGRIFQAGLKTHLLGNEGENICTNVCFYCHKKKGCTALGRILTCKRHICKGGK